MMKQFLSVLVLAGMSSVGLSFCGFYVAKADTKLFNKTSQVILVRDGQKTTVTMSNDFKGNVKDFAMVIPVPEVLSQEDIRVVPSSLFSKLDAYSGPRLVEYHDQAPCYQPEVFYNYAESVTTRADFTSEKLTAMPTMQDYGVKIEAKYEIEEYDVLILSAKESTGLRDWLIQNDYKIPTAADEVLEPYIKNNMKFFVVKVNADKMAQMSGMNKVKKYIDDPNMDDVKDLRPLQITYNSDKFMLPIRLGMANSTGEQDMVVYAFTKEGRVESTNYRTTKIPSNKMIPEFVRQKFGSFYVDLFEKAHKEEKKEAIFLEYAWNVSPQFTGMKCDPCVGPPPIFTDLKEAGVDWALNRTNQASNDVFFTRLHLRYARETHPQDLLFHVTPNKEHFQGRYIITNAYKGDVTCEEGQKYCVKVVKRRVDELENLEDLTAWNASEYKPYVKEYYNKLDDPSLMNRVEADPQRNEGLPIFPTYSNPNDHIKRVLIIGLLSLLLIMLVLREIKREIVRRNFGAIYRI
ncbi:DUF2330 domain-containing protein [Crocinitomix algicola]|uniref:DUF2330 domain-containing protein n=1 Tax=Crocinitomix algicola TaxID=1740263 RepID=UPI000871D9D9|nr:DUF2330 domain-containing protein [Crocinitomix algicola]